MDYAGAGHINVKAGSWTAQHKKEIDKAIAVETPVALIYNGLAHAVMMATPQDLEDFALGFSLSEGIITRAEEMIDIGIRQEENGLLLTMQIPEENALTILRRKRSLTGNTSCSLCGIETIEESLRMPSPVRDTLKIPHTAIYNAYDNLEACQPEKKITGAVHAAAFADPEGNILCAREDVGRHNALDKLIGAAIKSGIAPDSGFVFLTSRCSFEMVQKTVAFGAQILAAISAPTSLAVTLAEQSNLTLIALARKEQFVTFTHNKRVTSAPHP